MSKSFEHPDAATEMTLIQRFFKLLRSFFSKDLPNPQPSPCLERGAERIHPMNDKKLVTHPGDVTEMERESAEMERASEEFSQDDDPASSGSAAGGLRLRFWQAVSSGLAEKLGHKTQTPKDRAYFEVSLGRTGFFLSSFLYQGGEMAVRILINGKGKDELFQSLWADRQKIERELGAALGWSDLGAAKKLISLAGPALSLGEEADFAPAVTWMVDWIAKFKAVFEPRVKKFQP